MNWKTILKKVEIDERWKMEGTTMTERSEFEKDQMIRVKREENSGQSE